MSFGVHFLKAAQRDGAAILGDAMAAADSALYIAKSSGRDRVVSTCDATRGKARTLMSSGSVQMH
jgi:PleD family two-component response regulator